MRQLFDFECPKCSVVFEDLVDSSQRTKKCLCGGRAKRLISTPRINWRKMGLDPAFPSASDKWAKMQRQNHTANGTVTPGA